MAKLNTNTLNETRKDCCTSSFEAFEIFGFLASVVFLVMGDGSKYGSKNKATILSTEKKTCT